MKNEEICPDFKLELEDSSELPKSELILVAHGFQMSGGANPDGNYFVHHDITDGITDQR